MLKKTIIIVLFGFTALFATSYFILSPEPPKPSYEDRFTGQDEQLIYINGNKLTVEVADKTQEQSRGLSGLENLKEDEGMLFIFPEPTKPGFWMKDMNFSLDLIWIDENKAIIHITKDVSPDTFPKTFVPPSPIKYVLEVNAGWSDRNNIKIGDKVSGF